MSEIVLAHFGHKGLICPNSATIFKITTFYVSTSFTSVACTTASFEQNAILIFNWAQIGIFGRFFSFFLFSWRLYYGFFATILGETAMLPFFGSVEIKNKCKFVKTPPCASKRFNKRGWCLGKRVVNFSHSTNSFGVSCGPEQDWSNTPRYQQVPSANGDVIIAASGVGVGVAQLSVCYNTPSDTFETEPFKCTTNIQESNQKSARLDFCCKCVNRCESWDVSF